MQDKLDPAEALERLFAVISQEARGNPVFARRMLDAMAVSVVFTGTDAAKAADPILLAARGDYAAFRESFVTFAEKDLKALLKGYALATDGQIAGVTSKPKQSGLVDLLWDGAQRKIKERSVG